MQSFDRAVCIIWQKFIVLWLEFLNVFNISVELFTIFIKHNYSSFAIFAFRPLVVQTLTKGAFELDNFDRRLLILAE